MTDNNRHIIAGMAAALVVALPIYHKADLFCGVWACWAGVIAGIVKEWCDSVYCSKWNWRDLGFTCIGAAMVAVALIVYHLLIS